MYSLSINGYTVPQRCITNVKCTYSTFDSDDSSRNDQGHMSRTVVRKNVRKLAYKFEDVPLPVFQGVFNASNADSFQVVYSDPVINGTGTFYRAGDIEYEQNGSNTWHSTCNFSITLVEY